MWETFLLSYKYFGCQSCCLFLLPEVCENHFKEENISIGGSEQRRDELFWINFRQTWLINLFGLILVDLTFSTFIFSIDIKLCIRYAIVLFGLLILLERFYDFVQFFAWYILKYRQLCLHKYLKNWVLCLIIA